MVVDGVVVVGGREKGGERECVDLSIIENEIFGRGWYGFGTELGSGLDHVEIVRRT